MYCIVWVDPTWCLVCQTSISNLQVLMETLSLLLMIFCALRSLIHVILFNSSKDALLIGVAILDYIDFTFWKKKYLYMTTINNYETSKNYRQWQYLYNCHSKRNVRKKISISTYNQKNVAHKNDSWHHMIRRSVAHNYERKNLCEHFVYKQIINYMYYCTLSTLKNNK